MMLPAAILLPNQSDTPVLLPVSSALTAASIERLQPVCIPVRPAPQLGVAADNAI